MTDSLKSSAEVSGGASRIRTEIQALRAGAVLSVVVYHLWPARLSGGYAGVDVFFVISGFLIIGHLLREVTLTGSVSLGKFWANRARRLLPASLLVLMVTALATLLVVPTVLWQQWFREIAASAIYVQNFALSLDAVDYLAAENAQSPVQHFWSLSVEEQFYVLWPLAIIGVLALRRRGARWNRSPAIGVTLAVLTIASFVFSAVGVGADPASSYFATAGRAWEFGAGGLLAFAATRLPQGTVGLRSILSWGGLAAIAATMMFYSDTTPFPGPAALVPVLGTVAVIWAGAPVHRFAASALLALRPVQWIGGISYSLYLWHWPLIVILPIALARDLGTLDRVVIALAALALAWLTKVLVEDPFRRGREIVRRPTRTTLIAAVTATATVLVICAGGYALAAHRIGVAEQAHQTAIAEALSCLGAAAVTQPESCDLPFAVNELTNAEFAQTDIGLGVRADDLCKQTLTDSAVIECSIGDTSSPTTTVAVVGDSHAGHYFEALDIFGAENSTRFVMYLKTWCVGTGVAGVAARDDATDLAIDSCADWGQEVSKRIVATDKIDAVAYSNFTERYAVASSSGLGRPVSSEDFRSSWQPVIDSGKQLIVLRDLPNANDVLIPQCVSQNLDQYDPCATDKNAARISDNGDPMLSAARETPGVVTLDLADILCTEDRCHSVIGGLIVYFDSHHLSATFSRTLAPILGDRISDALNQ